MKGSGNNIQTLLEKLIFFLIPKAGWRTKYLYLNKKKFKHLGKDLFFQPRKFPSDPELIYIGDNVKIASNVTFINHDIVNSMLNNIKKEDFDEDYFRQFKSLKFPIKIGNNVMIGANTIILPNVNIGNNVIIGAGSVISKDIPNDSIVAGVPAKIIGDFKSFFHKRKNLNNYPDSESDIWKIFLIKDK